MINKSIPTDREIWESDIATYWMENGLLVSLSKPVKRTVQLIRKNVELVKQISYNKPVPLLIYLCKSPMPDKATRMYSTTQLPVIYTAMAMISAPGLSNFIMKLLFAIKPPPIPMKSFTDEASAIAWLQQFK